MALSREDKLRFNDCVRAANEALAAGGAMNQDIPQNSEMFELAHLTLAHSV